MANTFRIPLLNSFRWVNANPNVDARYNSKPFDDKVDQYNPNGPYYAKWQTNDKAQIQLLSDFVPSLNFYDYCSNKFYLNIPITPIGTQILGVTFVCYQAEVDFSLFAEGDYYGQITYNDGTQDQVWQTSPLNLAGKSLEYKTRQKDRLINYEIEFDYAFNEINSI